MLRQDSSAEEAPSWLETGVQRYGTMDLITEIMNVTKATLTMQTAVTSLEELSLDGFVMMDDLGLQTSVGSGVGMVKGSQQRNVMTTIWTSSMQTLTRSLHLPSTLISGLLIPIVTDAQMYVQLSLAGIAQVAILGEWITAGKYVGMDMTIDIMTVTMET